MLKFLMPSSAALYFVIGLLCLFVPDEIAISVGLSTTAAIPIQLISGGALGLGMLNWAGRSAIYGGIYGRPIMLANLMFNIVFSTTLLRATMDGHVGPLGWVSVVVFGAMTAGFFLMMRSPPWSSESDKD